MGWMNVVASQVTAAAGAVGEAGGSGRWGAWTDEEHQRLKAAVKPTN